MIDYAMIQLTIILGSLKIKNEIGNPHLLCLIKKINKCKKVLAKVIYEKDEDATAEDRLFS